MPEFCDVALPVPLEMTFTYRTGDTQPVVGGRVLVPFRTTRMAGIVTALHDKPPSMTAKFVITVMDEAPVLDADLLKLGEWIAQYYIAPIGEVFRTMLPLMAEVKQTWLYSIADAGITALHESATVGSSRRSKKSSEDQMIEYAVLDHLANADEGVREGTLRSAAGANKALLSGILRKKWIAREDASQVRDASRTVRVAVLREAPSAQGTPTKLNENQQTILVA